MAVVNLELMYALESFKPFSSFQALSPFGGIIGTHFAWGTNQISCLVVKNLALLRSQLINDHTSSALQVCLWDLRVWYCLKSPNPDRAFIMASI